ncbi:uracil-DNA glycosylase [Bacteroidetes/Chlorobi group bacterium Naka2016]|jgi:DNA polymerase|nr:MAG: uracil-DNA glycosylase [Bacteroidetes/Chlorobi group bacterium Naka2016]
MEVTKKVENFLKFLKENYGETISSLISYSKQSENLLIKETKQSDYSSKITHSLDIFSTNDDWYNSKSLEELESRINRCIKCELGKTRTKFVFGSGNPNADIMLVGEAPGADEDIQGLPFVGRAGQLLTKLLKNFGIDRNDVYICNILKCRPPNNRKPLPSEIEMCKPYLLKQIELIQPKVIIALGATAVEGLFNLKKKMGELRGKILNFNQIPVIVTYHPAALLRNPNWEKEFLDDLTILHKQFPNVLKGKRK